MQNVNLIHTAFVEISQIAKLYDYQHAHVEFQYSFSTVFCSHIIYHEYLKYIYSKYLPFHSTSQAIYRYHPKLRILSLKLSNQNF